jgi:hypothetical protein
MATKLTFTIKGIQADLSHTEPSDSTIAGGFNGGQNMEFNVGQYTNTSINTDQTVSFVDITELVNCTFVSTRWSNQDGTFTATPDVLVPKGKYTKLLVTVALPTQVVGSSDLPASFKANVVWS